MNDMDDMEDVKQAIVFYPDCMRERDAKVFGPFANYGEALAAQTRFWELAPEGAGVTHIVDFHEAGDIETYWAGKR